MITLMTFAACDTQPSHSPYCVKAMCLLEMAGQKWRREDLKMPSKAPLGKLPVLRVGDRLIPDTEFIQHWLEEQGADFHVGLDAVQRAHSHGIVRMVEGSIGLAQAHDRWLRDDNWEVFRELFFGDIPALIRGPITKRIRKGVRNGLMAQGIARFSESDRLLRVGADFNAIQTTLGDKPFLFGDAPTLADAATVPVFDMISTLPNDSGLRRLMRENDTLMGYVDRGRRAMYPREQI